MQVSISGQHISIGNSLQDYVKKRSMEINKYFSTIVNTEIHFSKQGFQIVCHILINDGTGRHVVLQGNGTADDAYAAFDLAMSKLQKQLKKDKSKFKDRGDRIKLSEIVPKTINNTVTHDEEDDDEEEKMEETAVM